MAVRSKAGARDRADGRRPSPAVVGALIGNVDVEAEVVQGRRRYPAAPVTTVGGGLEIEAGSPQARRTANPGR